MQREIKFRGKRVNNGEWVYGYYGYKVESGKAFIIVETINVNCDSYFTDYEVDSETVGQYTGLHDKADGETELFEHDIVEFVYKDKTYIGVVKFEAGTFILACNSLPDEYITLLDIIQSDRDYFWIKGGIKGNIHNNPELMKDGE
jgi:uncharacterized phage protein (TIGR01671 family)